MNLNLQRLLSILREERAERVRPGSDQEAAWCAIVPNPELRAPVQAPALPSPVTNTETETTEINPS